MSLVKKVNIQQLIEALVETRTITKAEFVDVFLDNESNTIRIRPHIPDTTDDNLDNLNQRIA